MPHVPHKVHSFIEDTGYTHGLAGHRIDHHMMLNGESPVPFGEIGPSVSYAGIICNRLESLLEGGSIDLLLPRSTGFIGVLQDVLQVRRGLTGENQREAIRGGHRDYRFLAIHGALDGALFDLLEKLLAVRQRVAARNLLVAKPHGSLEPGNALFLFPHAAHRIPDHLVFTRVKPALNLALDVVFVNIGKSEVHTNLRYGLI